MEQTSFELTPEQKGMLATLSRATGKPIPALLTEALEVLQERERSGHAVTSTMPPSQDTPKPIWAQLFMVYQNVRYETSVC